MQKNILPLLAFLVGCTAPLFSQQWGYATLIARQNTNSVQLLDTNNVVLKQWSNLTGNNAYSAYLTEGGDLWRTVKATTTSINGGGVCGRVQKIAWNGTLLFDYTISDANQVSHHDICPLPNGNVMLIVYEKKTATQVQAAGATINAERWSEKIVELKPTGLNTAQIVWQWNLWDHLAQNLYPAKANYQTSIIDHPELLNINYKNTGNMADWVHMNGIDYNAALDQIVVSSHNLNEMWVIDHSTTTAQAASHTGGKAGKGGDFLYRWGNPAAYGASGTTVFNVMHDAHWVPADCPRAGWLAGFNNRGVSNSISAVDLFEPSWNGTSYTLTPGQAYQPSTYGYRHQANGYTSNMGSSQQLPNGNMLICLATAGKVYEINANGTQLWQYTTTGAIPQAKRYSKCFIETPKVTVATANPSICSGGSVQLDITPAATDVNTFTYQWGAATGLSSTIVQDPLVSGLTASTTYTVTVTTAAGCSATASIPVTVLPPPAANAGADVNIQSGQSTTLAATGGVSYVWSTGAITANATVSPTTSTSYTVTVTGANGCTATDVVVVSVSSTIVAQAAATTPALCPGSSTELSATASGGSGNFTYTWSSIPTGFVSNQRAPTVTPSISTIYVVTVSDGQAMATASISITVHPAPVANAGQDVSITTGQSATLTATGGASFLWSTGGNRASISVSPSSNTTYTVTVTDANGCTASDAVTVKVNTLLPLSGSISATSTTVCLGDVVQLFATASNGTGNYAYLWTSEPSGFTSTLPDPIINPEETTRYTVEISDGVNVVSQSLSIVVNPLAPQPIITASGNTLTSSSATNNQWFYYGNPIAGATDQVFNPIQTGSYQVQVLDQNGCSSPLSEPYEYIALLPLTGSISATDTTVCLGDVVQLLATASNGTGTYTYQWTSEPAGFSSSLPDPFVNPEETTRYSVKISDGVNVVAQSLDIVVNPLAPQPIITASGSTLTSSSTTNNQWFYYGNPIPGATDQVFNPTQIGSYQVQVIDENGCFSPLSEPYEYLSTSTGQVLADEKWTVVPNPATDQVSVLGDFDQSAFSVEIWNSAGRMITQARNTNTFVVTDLPSGVYWLRLRTADGTGMRKVLVFR